VVAATANWVVHCETTRFDAAATNQSRCSKFGQNEVSWDEVGWGEVRYMNTAHQAAALR